MALSEAVDLAPGVLAEALENCAARARQTGMARVFALGLPVEDCDPLAAYAEFGAEDRFFWGQRARAFSIAGRGAVLEVESSGGSAGTVSVSAAIAEHFDSFDRVGEAAPLFVGGFAFDARATGQGDWERFPAGRMVLPELLLRRCGEETRATLCLAVEPGADPQRLLDDLLAQLESVRKLEGLADCPSPGASDALSDPSEAGAEYRVVADRSHRVFHRQVESALADIQAGGLEKVVLARSLEVFHPGRFAIPSFLEQLGSLYPHCTVLACGRGEDTLVAASPELLVSLREGEVEACALAGSAARGRSPEEDAELSRALRESKKEQAEHEAVARTIRAGLTHWTEELEGPEAPELMRVLGIQHLATPFRGRLAAGRRGAGVLDLVASLHPTPAVAGLPRQAALDWIAENEGLARGWYAGPIGWVDAEGGGEFWLALRSALVRNAASGEAGAASRARLFAGAGLVDGSVPQAELVETRLKLRALLAPLTEI